MNALVQTEEFMETAVRLLAKDIPTNSWLDLDDLTAIEQKAATRLARAGLVVMHYDHTLFQRRRLFPERRAVYYFKASGAGMLSESARRAWRNAVNEKGFRPHVEPRIVLGAEGIFTQLSEEGAIARSDLRKRENLRYLFDHLRTGNAETDVIEMAYLEPLRSQQTAKQQGGDRSINVVAMPGSTISNFNTGDISWNTEHHFHDAVETTPVDVLQICDAKYKTDVQSRLTHPEFSEFARWVELFELRGATSARPEFAALPALDGNCLVTNGNHSTEPDAECLRVSVREVAEFSPATQQKSRP